MIYVINIIILLLLSVLSLSFLPSFGLFQTGPLLPLFFVIALSYFRKGFEPLFLAIISGMIFDFFSPYPFGLYLLVFLGATVTVRLMFQEEMKELSFYNYIMWSSAFSVIYIIAEIIILQTNNVEISAKILLPSASSLLVNVVFAFFLYFGIVWYFDRIKDVENALKIR